jgi:hypothetical protein
MPRGVTVLGASLLAVTVLSACDPAAPPDVPDEVSMELVVGADGSGTVHLGFGDRPDAERLQQMATQITSSGFVGRRARASVDSNDGGHPFLVLHADDVFEPGPAPQVQVDVPGLCQQVRDFGYRSISLSLSEPYTEHEWLLMPADRPWEGGPVESCSAAPVGTLSMHPQPWRWAFALVLLGVCLVANLIILRLRRSQSERRAVIVVLGAVAVVAAGIGVFTAAGVQGDNLVVRGWVDGGWFAEFDLVAPALVVPLGLWAIVQIGLASAASKPKALPGPQPNEVGGVT